MLTDAKVIIQNAVLLQGGCGVGISIGFELLPWGFIPWVSFVTGLLVCSGITHTRPPCVRRWYVFLGSIW